MRTYQVISADGHLEGPVDWTKWVAAKYKDAVPKLFTRPDGAQGWRTDYAGVQTESVLGSTLQCGLRYDEYTPKLARTYFNPDGSVRPGCGDNVQRLREQDIDGIDAEVLFFGGGLGGAVNKFPDADANLALVRAYNDRLADYCSIAPDRLIGAAVIPANGIDEAIAEMERCKKMGLITVCPSMWPNGGLNPAPEDDRFWAAALDMDMKISPHITFGSWDWPTNLAGGPDLGAELVVGGQRGVGQGRCGVTIARLIAGGVFDRFPKLKIYLAETQAGWSAPHLDLMDDFFQRWYSYHNLKLKKQPSQYYRDHLLFSFIYDRMAMKLRQFIGVDMLMWGSDFPHSVGTYPDSRETLTDLFEEVPEDEKRKVLVTNATDFFGLDPEKELTPTP